MATGPTTSPVPETRLQLPILPQQGERKHTWPELHSAVKATRRLQTSLTNRVPTEFTFRYVVYPCILHSPVGYLKCIFVNLQYKEDHT